LESLSSVVLLSVGEVGAQLRVVELRELLARADPLAQHDVDADDVARLGEREGRLLLGRDLAVQRHVGRDVGLLRLRHVDR
jgi:hypothetical protein